MNDRPAVQTFVLVTALYNVFFLLFFTVTMRLSLFLLNEHDDDDAVYTADTVA